MEARNLKIEAARAALAYVEQGMRLGIGSGSTADEFTTLLGERVAAGLEVVGVPTSERTAALCDRLDITIDGADEVDPALNLIKGGGGALLREKIVAAAAARMIVIADESKLVAELGRFPLPVEVNRFGLKATETAIASAAAKLDLTAPLTLRMTKGEPFVTDGGHYILDASFGRIPDTRALSKALHAVPGVVEHGLFLDLADLAIVAGTRGVRIIEEKQRTQGSPS